MTATAEAVRVCKKCGEPGVLGVDFYRDPLARGGYKTACRACLIRRGSERYRRSPAYGRRVRARAERERAVLGACLALIAEGLHPGRNRLAARVPGWNHATLVAVRDGLVSRGELAIPPGLVRGAGRPRPSSPTEIDR